MRRAPRVRADGRASFERRRVGLARAAQPYLDGVLQRLVDDPQTRGIDLMVVCLPDTRLGSTPVGLAVRTVGDLPTIPSPAARIVVASVVHS